MKYIHLQGSDARVARAGFARAAAAPQRPAADRLLQVWPADPGLPQLSELLDARRALAWYGDEPAHVELLRYEPGQRATLRYRSGTRVLYAKTFRDDHGARIRARFEHFWSLAQDDPEAPLVARPLAWHAHTRTVWQPQASGVPLQMILAGTTFRRELPDRLARALGRLHAAVLPAAAMGGSAPRPAHDSTHWLREVRRRQRRIARAVPRLATRAARVADALEARAAALPSQQAGLIHGDFHAARVAVDASRIVLFDFDQLALGDPMEDLAAIVSRLPSAGVSVEFGACLITAYARGGGTRFCPRQLRWHLAVQSLLQASRALGFQTPERRGELERHLAKAEGLCALIVSGPPG